MLKKAEELADIPERSPDEEELKEMPCGAREELKLAELLGYGNRNDYTALYSQLDRIEAKTRAGKSGTGFFDPLKKSLSSYMELCHWLSVEIHAHY